MNIDHTIHAQQNVSNIFIRIDNNNNNKSKKEKEREKTGNELKNRREKKTCRYHIDQLVVHLHVV